MLNWDALTEELVNEACLVPKAEHAINRLMLVLNPSDCADLEYKTVLWWTPPRMCQWDSSTPAQRRRLLNQFLDWRHGEDMEILEALINMRPPNATLH